MTIQSVLYQILTIIHFVALGGAFAYGLHRLWFISWWLLYKYKPKKILIPIFDRNKAPLVTIQLPVYNERFVVTRLIDSVAKLDWPLDCLEIQILDDSSDETRDIIDKRVAYWKEKKINIKVLRRDSRVGYKAGALSKAINTATGDFIAIFDADFIPPKDFLIRTVPHFENQRIGMVQCNWSYINSENSWLTKIQALSLGAHFGIEHQVRFSRGLFFNFNGTAGIWRKNAIVSSGGWQIDTVTEDLDLSYRAQLKGWQFIYLDDLKVPSELPPTLSAYRTQQYRWAKGSIQTARKILPKLIRNPNLSVMIKFEAMAHLLSNLGWLFGSLIAITLFTNIIWYPGVGFDPLTKIDVPLFFNGCGAFIVYYFFYAIYMKRKSIIMELIILVFFAIGISPNLAFGVLDGLIRKGGHFERTPKFGIFDKDKLPKMASLYSQTDLIYLVLNIALFIFSITAVYATIHRSIWQGVPLILMFSSGFLLVLSMEGSKRKIIKLKNTL